MTKISFKKMPSVQTTTNEQDMEYKPQPNSLVIPLVSRPSPYPLTKIITNLFSIPIVLLFKNVSINRIICTFWVWHLSLSKMLFLRFIHVLCVSRVYSLQKKSLFFFIVEQCSFYGCKSLTILKSMDIWLFLIFGYYKRLLL